MGEVSKPHNKLDDPDPWVRCAALVERVDELQKQAQSQQEWIDRVAKFSTDAATAADKAEREVKSLQEQLEAKREEIHKLTLAHDAETFKMRRALEHAFYEDIHWKDQVREALEGWVELVEDSIPATDPLGYIELDEHGMCPHDYAKGLGCHVCDPASDPFSGEPGTSSSAGGSWGNSNQDNRQKQP